MADVSPQRAESLAKALALHNVVCYVSPTRGRSRRSIYFQEREELSVACCTLLDNVARENGGF
jgi:hypothetical protein